MKADFATKITTLRGKAIKVPGDEGPEDLTLGTVSIEALLDCPAGEKPKDKLRRFKLSCTLLDAGEIDLGEEDANLLRRAIGAKWPPLVVGRAFESLGLSED